MEQTLAMILAGGVGERLYPLTKVKAKPAVPFGGIYRIIDFTLSNCLHSGIRRIFVLTQHKSLPLDRHLWLGWSSLFRTELGEFLATVPPQQRLVREWYRGTADAVFQNIDLLSHERPKFVLILAGDHVYRMDYRAMLQFHLSKNAEVTIACTTVPIEDASRFGVMEVDENDRIIGFEEKPQKPKPLPNDPSHALISMGIYLFNTETLVRAVIQDAKRTDSDHDFGKNVIPSLVQQGAQVFAFNIRKELPPLFHYWQDIGTLDSYYEAHMELISPTPLFPLHDDEWTIRTYLPPLPPAVLKDNAVTRCCLVSPGCVIEEGAIVEHSILSPGVYVGKGTVVRHSILLHRVRVNEGCRLEKVIVDEDVIIPQGEEIGVDLERDRRRFTVTERGVVIIPVGVAF
ncbi:glucose-1-phosphate adenylyltransferase [Fervidibacter sacchari]|uniref:glucose-1-phosphate adenylyltransferase n=1 Tax=Candidatus Fervidibacter sacchari TaxID=1448929 RepID=UPI00216A62FC|nr:glucose-1-phosphate adenylyltransferase [Candidatus Fervidibacter sacchari]WKU18024.1 glucose-1-phosphate adenylyltransferase [Candidatus Fervidibacter sacchari]